MSGDTEAVDLLYKHLGALPHPEYGTINLFPWAVETKETNVLKRQACEAIIGLLRDGGFLAAQRNEPPVVATAAPGALRDVRVNCRMCSTTLLRTMTDENGVANVPAANLIASLTRMSHECPHNVLTLEDYRRSISEAVAAAQAKTAEGDRS